MGAILPGLYAQVASQMPKAYISMTMEYSNILLVRTDRIGDVVLTLPMIAVVRRKYPKARISMLVRRYTLGLVSGHRFLDEAAALDDLGSIFRQYRTFRKKKYDAVVFAYPRFRLALLMFLAGVPVRVGTGYRWYSFLFNRRVYEHRKDGRYHELEYNLHLLEPLGCPREASREFFIPVDRRERDRVAEFFSRNGIAPGDRVVVLHPGSGGSARDWPTERFGELGRQLKAGGYTVVVTGSADEKPLVESVAGPVESGCIAACGEFSLRELAALFERTNAVVANSTGPLHIAAAVGTPVVGFYPPIIQCSPQRWGPVTEKKLVFEPDRSQCRECAGGPCRSSRCMEQISVASVAKGVHLLVEKYSTD